MSGLFHMTLRGGSGLPNPASFRMQTSNYGLPIPLVYGTARVAGNIVHYLDPTTSVAYGQQPHSKFIAVASQPTGYNYTAAVVLALCEGPIDGVANFWSDKNAAALPSAGGFDVSHLGTLSQAAWSYLTTNHPTQAVPYQFVAYAAHPSLQLPNNVLPNFTWEIQGLKRFAPGSGIIDAIGSDILTDYLTDPQHGVGWPSSLIGSMTQYINYCAALGLWVSTVEDQQRPGADFLNELMQATNSALVWSDGVLKVIPYGDQSASGSGYTFTPNTTPLYDLTDDDYLKNGDDDPVLVTRKAPVDRYNQVFVEYENRGSATAPYNVEVVEAKDQAAIDQIAAATGGNGLRPMPKVSLPMIKLTAVARLVSQLLLQRAQYICNTYSFRVGWRFSLLEPMDLITLTDSGLGLNHTPVRITAVEELQNDEGLQITAEDWPFGVASATAYTTQGGNGFAPNFNVSPGNTTTPIIFEGPVALQSSPLELWIAASGGASWGGCDVWVSTDNSNFTKVGTIVRKANYGTLTSSITSSGTPLAVDLTTSGGSLVSYSATDYANLVPLCYVDGEFVAYETATLTSGFHYNLTTLTRGLYGTSAAAHSSGTNFVFCDGAVLRLAYPQGTSGQTIYFKFPAFNIYGQALQDISTVSSVSHVIGRSPIIPGTSTLFTGVSQTPTYNTSPTQDTVAMGWGWGGDPSAVFDIYIVENQINANPAAYPAFGSPTASGLPGTPPVYTYTVNADIDPTGTAGRKAWIGFYVVARTGATVLGVSARSEVVYNRN